MFVVDNFHAKIRYTYTHIFSYVFKTCIGFVLSNSANEKKKYIWNVKYTIQLSIDRSQTIKCIQYNLHDTNSYELPKRFHCCKIYVKSGTIWYYDEFPRQFQTNKTKNFLYNFQVNTFFQFLTKPYLIQGLVKL